MEFNPSRLDLARRRRELTKGELSELVGITPRALLAYERRESSPPPRTLSIISSALGFPQEFFFGDDLEEPSLDASSFRAMSRLTVKQRGRCLASGALALSLSDWIGKRFRLPTPALPRFDSLSPEMAAAAVRSEWHLGEKPIPNMIHLLESRGVRVFSLVEETVHLDAFSLWRGDLPYVFLNTNKSAEHSRMDAAHELGHLVLHWRGGVRGRDVEHEAQQFASAFLLPRADLLANAPKQGTLAVLIHLKRRWGVSVAALVYRMHSVGLLSDYRFRQLFLEISKKGYRRREPNGCRPETSQVLSKVFRSLRDDGVTLTDVASELRIAPSELSRSLFGLTLAAV